MKSSAATKKLNFWYYIILLILAVTALVITFLPYAVSFGPTAQKFLSITGTIIYAVFFVDFLYFWHKAKWERRYLRDNWISLVALILPLKGLKALKGLKFLKGVKALKVIKLGKKVKSKSKALSK